MTINIQFQKTGTGFTNPDNDCDSFDITGERSYFKPTEAVHAIIKFNYVDVETNTVLYLDKWDGSTWINKWASENKHYAAPATFYRCVAFGVISSSVTLGDWRMRTVINEYEFWIGFNVTESPPPRYDCVNFRCVERADGPYDDPTCMDMCGTPTDKYYGCVNNQCVEKADGPYKNDPTCQGTCATPPPNDMLPLILGLGAIGASVIYFMAKKR